MVTTSDQDARSGQKWYQTKGLDEIFHLRLFSDRSESKLKSSEQKTKKFRFFLFFHQFTSPDRLSNPNGALPEAEIFFGGSSRGPLQS